MRTTKGLILIALLAALVFLQITIATARERASYTLPTNIHVWMYWLDRDGHRREPDYRLCASGDTSWGCTAFCDEPGYPCDFSQILPYPYVHGSNEPATVALETNYLMDVVPQEMDPNHYPNLTALRAQAIAARTYACYYAAYPPQPPRPPFNNSSGNYQAFIPYKFETLAPGQQNLVGMAVSAKQYLSLPNDDKPTFIEFFDDIVNHTVTDPDGAMHLLGVPDPISNGCDTVNWGHGRGMSQRGANRWSRGDRCASPYQGSDPWRLSWSRPEQILAHYYRAVEFQGFSSSVPSYHRWNVLDHNIPAAMLVDGAQAVGMWVQNTSVATWEFRAENAQLPQIKCYWYKEDGSAAGLGGTYQVTAPKAPGETDVYWFYLTSPTTSGTYFLRCDMGRYEYDHDQHMWVWRSFYVSGWPMQEQTVSVFPAACRLYLPLALKGYPGNVGGGPTPTPTLPAYPPPTTPTVTPSPLPPPTMPPLTPGPLTAYRTGTVNANHNWTAVTFPTPFSEPPALLVTIMTENEGDTADVDVRHLTQHGFEVRVEEDTRAGWNGTHATETLAWFAVAQPSLSHQAGLAIVDHNWTTVHFAMPFSAPPVLLATVASEFESDTAHVDVRNVTTTCFQVRVEEDPRAGWDGGHVREAVAWFAATTPPAGCQIGKVSVNHNWTTVTFPTPLALASRVQATIMTNNEGDTVRVDVRRVTATGFQVRVEEDTHAGWDGPHATETIGWLACYP